jgi:hypothetical protein
MRRFVLLALVAGLAAGCGSSAGTSPTGPAGGFAVRAWVTQAIPPVDAFPSAGPSLAINDGLLIVPGPVPAIYPGPLLPNLQQRPISDAGLATIHAAAAAAGLLDGPTDLTGGTLPGGQTAHLLFVIDGVEREVLGNPGKQIVCITTPCEAAPGSPEAFAGFWSRLTDVAGWLGAELGQETPWEPGRVAVLLTEPRLDATIPPSFIPWPLDEPMDKFGTVFATPEGTPPVRCGVIEGDELAAALAAFRSANQLTRWTDAAGNEYGAVVRPLFPGEPDPCGP